MTLKAKSSDTDESLDNKDSKIHYQAIQEVHEECHCKGLRQGP